MPGGNSILFPYYFIFYNLPFGVTSYQVEQEKFYQVLQDPRANNTYSGPKAEHSKRKKSNIERKRKA